MRLKLHERILSGVLCLACLSVLIISAWLSVGQADDGTLQRSLGMHECGFKAVTGHPCATCGMTRAYALTSSGRVVSAARLQPTGTLFSFATACTVWLSGLAAITGSRLGVAAVRVFNGWFVWTGIGLLAAGWIYTLSTWSS